MGVAVQTQAYAMTAHPSYVLHAQRWHAYLIYAFIVIIFALVNVFGAKLMHPLNMSGWLLVSIQFHG